MALVKKYWFVIIGVILAVIAGFIYMRERNKPTLSLESAAVSTVIVAHTTTPVVTEEARPLITEAPLTIKVYITGAVQNPGVYEVTADVRVDDVLQIAGGPTEEADLLRVNLAAFVKDAQQIIVPAVGDPTDLITGTENIETTTYAEADSSFGQRVNINTANAETLTTLPGIGPVIAQNIINYRTTYGTFKSLEEIKNVDRIGDATYEKIKDYIAVD